MCKKTYLCYPGYVKYSKYSHYLGTQKMFAKFSQNVPKNFSTFSKSSFRIFDNVHKFYEILQSPNHIPAFRLTNAIFSSVSRTV